MPQKREGNKTGVVVVVGDSFVPTTYLPYLPTREKKPNAGRASLAKFTRRAGTMTLLCAESGRRPRGGLGRGHHLWSSIHSPCPSFLTIIIIIMCDAVGRGAAGPWSRRMALHRDAPDMTMPYLAGPLLLIDTELFTRWVI